MNSLKLSDLNSRNSFQKEKNFSIKEDKNPIYKNSGNSFYPNLKLVKKILEDDQTSSNSKNKEDIKRIEDLISYNILDTPADLNFDIIAKICAILCNTPISLINFIDKERCWLKSKIGIDINEALRDISFCNLAIKQN